jgi:putative ABC transport system permease protein
MRQLLRRIRYLANRDRHESDLEDELRFHREMKAQELRDRGLADSEVASATQRALGNDLSARQQSRDVWIWPWLQDVTQDIRFGFRMLLKDRRFTAAAVVALALGIAVNNSVFTIVNAALLRDLPFEDASRLIRISMVDNRGDRLGLNYQEFQEWRDAATSFQGLSAHTGDTMNVSDAGHPAERLRGTYISASGFGLLRVQPILGRAFLPEDEQEGAPPVAILAYDVWQGRYGGDATVVGRSIRVNDVPTTVVGIMPPGMNFPLTAQIWQPLTVMPGLSTRPRSARNISVFGRLKDSIELGAARAEVETLAARAAQQFPDSSKDLRLAVMTLKESTTGTGVNLLWTLMGAVGFVLLIACANVANLLLARASQRSREIAVRASLGASRWRIVRQLLIECTLIALVAGSIGFVLSIYGVRAMSIAFNVIEVGAPDSGVKPYWVDLSMNGLAWMFLGILCLLASLGAGLIPAWHLAKTDVNDALKEGGRSGAGGIRARRMASGLMMAELALTLILLTGAGLMIRSFFALYLKDVVAQTSGLVTMRLALPLEKYATNDQRQRFVDALHSRLTGVPMFESVTLGSDIPLQPMSTAARSLTMEAHPLQAGEKPPTVTYVDVGPRYLETFGLHILRGRGLTDADGLPGQEGAVVNERFASMYFQGDEVLGQRIQLTGPALSAGKAPWLTIVGVTQTLPVFFPGRTEEPAVYIPYHADPASQRFVSVIVRTGDRTSKLGAAKTLREQAAALDPGLPLFALQTMDEAVARSRMSTRVLGSWFITLAIIALTLASVGLYALTAHGVAQRTHEIGVRVALGARPAQVVRLFLRRTIVQLAVGLVLGLWGSLAIGSLLRGFISEIDPRDPLTLALVVALLVGVAFVASLLPSRRAAKVDPAVALRAE